MTGATASTEVTALMPAPLSLRDEQKQLTRRRILAAAQSTFVEHGFAAASVDTITTRAGMSRQTFYQYFRNKSDVLEALLHEPSDLARAALQTTTQLGKPTRRVLEQFLDSLIDHYTDHCKTYEIVIQAQAIDPTFYDFTHRVRERFVDGLTEYLQQARELAGRPIPESEARVEAQLLEAQMEYFCYLWIVRGWDADRQEVVAALARTWYAAIRGTGAR